MSNLAGTDFIHYTPQGVFFYESSSVFIPSVSQSSISLITQITCSADVGNDLAVTSSLSKFFVIPLISGSPSNTTLIPSQLNVIYNTGSFFTISSSNTASFYQPTSSDTILNYNLNVSIEKNDNANVVALKTYNAITSSLVYKGTSYNYISASVTGSAITVFNTFSQSLSGFDVVISAPNMTANIIQSGSYGSGSITNFTAPKGTIPVQSSSLVIKRDTDDTTQSSFVFKVQSGSFGGTEDRDILYISASEGKVGVGTSDPLTDVDIRANDFQIQRKTERRGLKVNTDGNIESFDNSINATSATTGSEFVLRYSRGVTITPAFMTTFAGLTGNATGSNNANALTLFNALRPDDQSRALARAESGGAVERPVAGDILGSIRWVSDSGSIGTLDERGTGETAVIQAIISDSTVAGVKADLVFKVATTTGGATQKMVIDANNIHQLTGSFTISQHITASGNISSSKIITPTIETSDTTVGITLTGNVTASGVISSSGNIVGELTGIGGAVTGINSILATDLVLGEDVQTKIDFGTADQIEFYANEAHEVTIRENSMAPGSNDGTALGSTSRQWSDLFLAEGGVINFDNGDVTLTQTGNTLDVAGTANTNIVGHVSASGNMSASQVFDNTYYQWEVSVQVDTNDDTNWQGPPNTGITTGTVWNKDFGTAYNGTSNIVQTRSAINNGWRIPHSANYSCSIKNIDVYVGGRSNVTIDATDHLSASLWYSTAEDVNERLNQTGTTGLTQRHGGTVITTQVGQTLVKFNQYHISQSINVDLAPGAMLFPRVKMADGSSQNLLWDIYWVINYCKKPL